MKEQYEPDFDDVETGLEDDVDVEVFLRRAESREEKRKGRTLRRSAWREIERRMERRALSVDLGEFCDD